MLRIFRKKRTCSECKFHEKGRGIGTFSQPVTTHVCRVPVWNPITGYEPGKVMCESKNGDGKCSDFKEKTDED